jgi:EmrB/QacA subfamily drug resistance transporter
LLSERAVRPRAAEMEVRPPPAPGAGRRQPLTVAAIGMAILMVTIDSTIVATALPTLTRELHTSLAWSSWTITIYQLGEIVSLPVAGRLSDSLGRRRMFIVYVGTFTIASLLAGVVGDIYVLIALRFVQALGGGGLMPSAMGVVSDLFTRERDRALGLVTSLFPVGALLGPAVGGFIVTYSSWREIFFVNVPVGAVLIALLWILLPSGGGGGAPRPRIDVAGAVLLAGALLSAMLGLSQLGERGPASPLPWLLLAAGGVLVAAFLAHERRSPDAILPPPLLRRRAFAVVNALNVLYGAVFGILALVPAFAQLAYGFSPLTAGSLLSVRAVGLAALSVVSSMLLRRLGYRAPMAAGFLVLACGLALLSLPPPGAAGPLLWLGLSALACGVGIGIAGPPSNNAAVQLMPDQVAAISGLRAMFRQTGGIAAITLTTLTIGSGPNQAGALSRVFAVFAALAVLMAPAVLGVPERPPPPL